MKLKNDRLLWMSRGYGVIPEKPREFAEYSFSMRKFFRLLVNSRQDSISVLDAAGGNGKRVLSGLRLLSRRRSGRVQYTLTDIASELLDEFDRDYRPILQKIGVSTVVRSADLGRTWPFPDSAFDASISSFGLHWLGERHARGLSEMVRTLRRGGYGYISSVTQLDSVCISRTFDLKYSESYLHRLYPYADSIGLKREQNGRKVRVVHFGSRVEHMAVGREYVLIRHHRESLAGGVTVAGFRPEYIARLLREMCCEIIHERTEPNEYFPNGFSDSRSKSRLFIIFRKL